MAPPAVSTPDVAGAGDDGSQGEVGSSSGVNRTPFIVIGVILALVLVVGIIVAVASDASTDEPYSLEVALDDAAATSSVQYDMTLFVGDESAFTVEGAVDGDVVQLGVDVGALMGAEAAGSTAVIIYDAGDGVLYIQADELIPSTPLDLLIPDLGWIAIDTGELDLEDGDEGVDIVDALAGNPLIVIDLVDADPSDATDLGAETIDGTETRHYQFMVDVAASVEIPEQLSDLADQFGFDLQIPEGALGEVTYDVWVTEDSQLRRVEIGFEIADESISIVVDVLALGGDVEVVVPSSDDVFDLGELFDFGAILDLGELFGS